MLYLIYLFFFNDTATTEIYTLSLHDALPILEAIDLAPRRFPRAEVARQVIHSPGQRLRDRKSTRLNSSHLVISYAVFCLKKKNTRTTNNNLSNCRVKSFFTSSLIYSTPHART